MALSYLGDTCYRRPDLEGDKDDARATAPARPPSPLQACRQH